MNAVSDIQRLYEAGELLSGVSSYIGDILTFQHVFACKIGFQCH